MLYPIPHRPSLFDDVLNSMSSMVNLIGASPTSPGAASLFDECFCHSGQVQMTDEKPNSLPHSHEAKRNHYTSS